MKNKSLWQRFNDWVNGDGPDTPGRIRSIGDLPDVQPKAEKPEQNPLRYLGYQRKLYAVAAVLVCLSLLLALTYTVLLLPVYNDPNAPTTKSDDYIFYAEDEQFYRQLFAQYPQESVLARCVAMQYFDADANSRANSMWSDITFF